jgi:hypothetical protein
MPLLKRIDSFEKQLHPLFKVHAALIHDSLCHAYHSCRRATNGSIRVARRAGR